MPRPAGLVVYDGPSRLDGERVVGILTGLARPSSNPKTGPMLQLWILRGDRSPQDAVKSGDDVSVCGHCPLRSPAGAGFKGRRCYVNVGQAATAVWRAWRRGLYPDVGAGATAALRGNPLAARLGAYGDPAALPYPVLDWVARGRSHTGYTHQWTHPHFDPQVLRLCMASVESDEQIRELHRRFPLARYFRIRRPGEVKSLSEVQCPATVEGGFRSTCSQCRLCGGSSVNARNVSVAAHGAFVRAAWR